MNIDFRAKKKSWFESFSSQPHQPFFTFGIAMFVVMLLIFISIYNGFLNSNATLIEYHAYPMIFMIFVQFFLGFTYITFPKFLQTNPVSSKIYMRNFYIFVVGSLLYIISLFAHESLLIISSFILLIAQVYGVNELKNIYKTSRSTQKYDAKWILIAYISGIIAHLIVIAGYKEVGVYAGFYLFIFGLIFAVSQRMVLAFTSVRYKDFVKNRSKNLMEIIFGLLILKVLLHTFFGTKFMFVADLLLFLFFTKELIRWKLPFKKAEPILWVLYVALFWIPIGFFLSFLDSFFATFFEGLIIFEQVPLHTFALGYFVTILIGFGTRVVLGHSGAVPFADSYTTYIFLILQFIVILRVFAGVGINYGYDYIFWINVSALVLIGGLLTWSIRYVKRLVIFN